MEDANVAIRLKGFIDSQELSHSQFADKCGIPRPSLSQILSGRNKKVSDVMVGQIHKAFPELSILWLLFGEGDMISTMHGAPSVSHDTSEMAGADGVSLGGNDGISSNGLLFGDDEFDLFGSDSNSRAATRRVPQDAVARPGKMTFENSVNANMHASAQPDSNLTALNKHVEALKIAKKQIVEYENKVSDLQTQIEKLRKDVKSVSHITVYYDDNTFETFYPKR